MLLFAIDFIFFIPGFVSLAILVLTVSISFLFNIFFQTHASILKFLANWFSYTYFVPVDGLHIVLATSFRENQRQENPSQQYEIQNAPGTGTGLNSVATATTSNQSNGEYEPLIGGNTHR